MKIREPIVFQIAQRTWCINEFGMDAMFLIEGDEKALLIDTGTGVFNLPALVRRYTDKPLMVALTHGHVDHAGGISWFKEVYLHEDDFTMARELTREIRGEYLQSMLNQSDDLYDLSGGSLVDGPCVPELLPLAEGDVIHLGNRDILVYETPGHTIGSICFLDVRERILYSGDACNPCTLLVCSADSRSEKGTMSALLRSAEKIESLHPFYDRNYNGHIGYASAITSMDPMPENLTRDCIDLCRALLRGDVAGEPANETFGGDCLIARTGTMRLLYAPHQLK